MADDLSKRFVTEDQLEEKRKERQEEWDKVRKADDPMQAPEPEVDHDNRCLYDKLQSQKMEKDEEHAEKMKFKNQIRGLEKEETEFLDFVSERQQEIQRKKDMEENVVIGEFRNAMVSSIAGPSTSKATDKKSAQAKAAASKKSQKSLLGGAIKRKAADVSPTDEKKRKSSEGDAVNKDTEAATSLPNTEPSAKPDGDQPQIGRNNPTAKVIGILPGMGDYGGVSSESADSSSSDSDIESSDLNLFRRNSTINIDIQ